MGRMEREQLKSYCSSARAVVFMEVICLYILSRLRIHFKGGADCWTEYGMRRKEMTQY